MKTIVLFFVFLISTSSFAMDSVSMMTLDSHYRGFSQKRSPFLSRSLTLTPGIYKQVIDHTGKLPGQTFDQRYWIDTEYAPSPTTAPVIYHICGEGDATQGYFLNDSAVDWAKALGANLVYLEHRYYGTSLPFADFSADHMQYLTLDNVMEDLATFQKWVSQTQGWKGKWITVGGSYSGTLSALYRQKYPELVVGALAASAPMISGTGTLQGSQSDVDQLSSVDTTSDTGDRPWVYQSCITFAFWQTDGFTVFDPSPWLCHQLFGNITLVDSNVYNQKYQFPFTANSKTSPTNILFTYGSDDIWTSIGLSQQNNLNSNIKILVISGAGHHFDLNGATSSDSQDVIAARNTFLALAKEWLKN